MSKDKKIELLGDLLQEVEVFNPTPKKKEEKLDPVGKFKRSAHLTDQMLKYTYPKDNTLDLFSILRDETKNKIDERNIERSSIVLGLKLTPSETKVIDCLCKLLHTKSQIEDKNSGDYYTGNKVIPKKGDTPLAGLGFTIYEFTKEYIGIDKKVGGKDLSNVAKILQDLSKKEFLIKYREEATTSKGGKTIREIEDYQRIIQLPKVTQTEYNENNIEQSKTEETIVVLHPIFRSQIDSKFILYPNDILQRTILAYGSPNVSDATLRLRDYLFRELSSKRFTPEIGLEKLYYTLADKMMLESRKKLVKNYTDKALETVIKLGLLESFKVGVSKGTGEPKITFKINKDFK